jgi:hypothetical protein
MNLLTRIKQSFIQNPYPVLLVISWLIWCFSFQGFITGKLSLVSDALAYYEHFKYYIDQLMRGVYPMWDPTWSSGIPFEFFLRRIGSFNPFYSLIAIFRVIGFQPTQAYLLFLSVYYFVGMVGFYKLSKLALKDRMLAFIAFLTLMFSSLGTRLFDSYILLTFIPMVWFFYFLLAFHGEQKRHYFLGMIFTAMILFTTYVPFYFITILLCFIVITTIFYFASCGEFVTNLFRFSKKHLIFVLACLLIFSYALVPGILFFKEGKKGEFVLTYRHSSLKSQNAMEVDPEWNKWAMVEDVTYAKHYPQLKDFNFAILYVPVTVYIVFLLALFIRINKRIIFLFALGVVFFLIGSPDVTGFYNFLHKYVFYFKYFRNLHFFLWLVLLPLCILFLVEELKIFLRYKPVTQKHKILLFLFLVMIHGGILFYFIKQGNGLISTYCALAGSFLFLTLYFYFSIFSKSILFMIPVMMMVVSQPIEVFHYLQKNSVKPGLHYRYEKEYLKLRIADDIRAEYFHRPLELSAYSYQNVDESLKPVPGYFDTKWFAQFVSNINDQVLDHYRVGKLLVYDHVKEMPDNQINWEEMGEALAHHKNIAFINRPSEEQGEAGGGEVELVTEHSQNVQPVEFDVNVIRLKTTFPTKKFLVYNDSFYHGWQAFINGKEVPLYKANAAFKGIWVPAGEQQVTFRFGETWKRFVNGSLLLLFYLTFIFLAVLWWKDRKRELV